MRLTRRSFSRLGVAAALWTGFPRNLGAAEPHTLEANPVAVRLAETPAEVTKALGYNSASPGPALRGRAGERLELKFTNKLSEATALCFPGLRGPRAQLSLGGLGEPLIAPGATRSFALELPEPGFQLYGALLGPDPLQQCARGLFGALVIDELAPPAVDLEAIVVVSDWRLDANGAIADLGDASLGRGAGRWGSLVSVNGAPAPFQLSAPPGGRVRLRLGNASTARVLYLSIEGVKPQIIAVDGQPSALFAPLHNLLPAGPGSRFELMFDLPRDPGAVVRFFLRPEDTRGQEKDEELLVFATAGAEASDRGAIVGLADNKRLPGEIDLDRAFRAELVVSGGGNAALAINGVSAPTKPAFVIRRGSPVTLALANKTAFPQTLRLTGHVARLLHALDDGWDPYWRDIVIAAPGKTVLIAFVADNPGLWPLESPCPEQRNAGFMTTFRVV